MPYCPAHIFTAQCSDDCALADCNDLVISLQHGSRPVAGRGLIKYFFPNLICGWSVVQARRDRDPPASLPFTMCPSATTSSEQHLQFFYFLLFAANWHVCSPAEKLPQDLPHMGFLKRSLSPGCLSGATLGGGRCDRTGQLPAASASDCVNVKHGAHAQRTISPGGFYE